MFTEAKYIIATFNVSQFIRKVADVLVRTGGEGCGGGGRKVARWKKSGQQNKRRIICFYFIYKDEQSKYNGD